MSKSKCKKCGKTMNIPRKWADFCYDCCEKYDQEELKKALEGKK